MAKKSNSGIFIAIALIIVAVIIAPKLNFNFSTTNVAGDTQEQLNNPTSGDCYATLSKSTINAGDLITGTIKDGANTQCYIFANGGSGWVQIGAGITNSNGDWSMTDEVSTPGTYTFRALCGTCATPPVILQVNALDPSTCTDTDGGIMYFIGGKVTTSLGSVYDTCQPNGMDLLEFYCDAFGMKSSSGIGCINGCKEGDNGDYCKTEPDFIICHDGDVGIEPFGEQLQTTSVCHDNTQLVTDHCFEGTDSLIEYYCSPTGSPEAERTCDYVSYNCPGMLPGSHCEGGRCVY